MLGAGLWEDADVKEIRNKELKKDFVEKELANIGASRAQKVCTLPLTAASFSSNWCIAGF